MYTCPPSTLTGPHWCQWVRDCCSLAFFCAWVLLLSLGRHAWDHAASRTCAYVLPQGSWGRPGDRCLPCCLVLVSAASLLGYPKPMQTAAVSPRVFCGVLCVALDSAAAEPCPPLWVCSGVLCCADTVQCPAGECMLGAGSSHVGHGQLLTQCQ